MSGRTMWMCLDKIYLAIASYNIGMSVGGFGDGDDDDDD